MCPCNDGDTDDSRQNNDNVCIMLYIEQCYKPS